MSGNKIQKSRRNQILNLEKKLIKLADGKDVIGNGKEIVYHDKFKYIHTFGDGT